MFVVAGYGTVPSSKNLSTHRSLKGMSEAENRLQKIFKIFDNQHTSWQKNIFACSKITILGGLVWFDSKGGVSTS